MATAGALIRDLLYPRDAGCIACGRMRVDEAAWGLCHACAQALVPLEGPFCPRCGSPGWMLTCPECAIRPLDALDGSVAAYEYAGTAAALVRALKYRSIAPAVEALADGMASVAGDRAMDALVPVPLHRSRERRRGYNQSTLLSEAVSLRTGLPILHALLRERPTRTQTRLSHDERAQNVLGAFCCVQPVQGLRLLLIDDVLTTGATAVSCAAALVQGGAAEVRLLAAARAGAHTDA